MLFKHIELHIRLTLKCLHIEQCMEKLVGNPRLLCSHVLDLIGCMHLSLGLSRSNATKNNGFKNHYKINIQKKKMLIPGSRCSQINSLRWRTCLEKLENLSSCCYPHMCVSHAIPMHMAYAHCVHFSCMWLVRFSCMQLVCILCGSRVCSLCEWFNTFKNNLKLKN